MVEGPAPLDEPLGLVHEPAASEATLASAPLPRYSLKYMSLISETVGLLTLMDVTASRGSLGRCWRFRWNVPYLAHERTTSTRGGVVRDGAREIAAHRGSERLIYASPPTLTFDEERVIKN